MSRPVARYHRSPRYAWLGLMATCGALFSAWMGLHWPPSYAAAVLFALPAMVLFCVALQPAVELYDTHLAIGRRTIAWPEIRRIDRTAWESPLALHLTLTGRERVLILFPGDQAASNSLLRDLQKMSREALLDGVPYKEFWSEIESGAVPAKIHDLKGSEESARRHEPEARESEKRDASHLPPSSTSVSAQQETSDGATPNEKIPTDQASTRQFRLLLPEDEQEVEQMYQRLKTVGNLEARDSQE